MPKIQKKVRIADDVQQDDLGDAEVILDNREQRPEDYPAEMLSAKPKKEKGILKKAGKKLKKRSTYRNIDNLLALKSEVIDRSTHIYRPLRESLQDTNIEASNMWGRMEQRVNDLVADINKAMDAWKEGKSEEEWKYGDPNTGRLPPEGPQLVEFRHLLGHQSDFDKLRSFLDDRKLVSSALQPLSEAIFQEIGVAGLDDPAAALASLLHQLTISEVASGFKSASVVPLGILPAETFLNLIGEGYVLDDYGAGIFHGELTHRLQWYAITRAIEKGQLQLDVTDVRTLSRIMNTRPFSALRTGAGASVWGQVMDRGVISSADSYGFPGTLNRDLLEVGFGGVDALREYAAKHLVGVDLVRAWPGRKASSVTDLSSLYPIAIAIAHQFRSRLETARGHGIRYDSKGTHPRSVTAQHRHDLLAAGYQEDDGYLIRRGDFQ